MSKIISRVDHPSNALPLTLSQHRFHSYSYSLACHEYQHVILVFFSALKPMHEVIDESDYYLTFEAINSLGLYPSRQAMSFYPKPQKNCTVIYYPRMSIQLIEKQSIQRTVPFDEFLFFFIHISVRL
jgi:hypothetical protein